jgi:5'-nucleotidase
LHVNDTHSWLDAYGETHGRRVAPLGGIARAASIITEARAQSDAVLTLHAGDLMHGTEFFNGYFGVPELELMAALGFDAMTVGNHELDFGPAFLAQALRAANPPFPLLGANLDLSGYPALGSFIQPAVLRQVGAVSVGIFGMTTPDDVMYQPAPVRVLGAGDPARVLGIAATQAARLREQGAELVVLLSHLGADYDVAIAAQVPGVDVIVGGHTHSPTLEAQRIPNPSGRDTIYVRAGAKYTAVGKLRLRIDAGQVSLVGFERVLLDRSVAQDPEIQAEVEALKRGLEQRYGDLYEQVLSRAVHQLDGSVAADSPRRDSALGDLLTDAYRARTGTELAFTPTGLFEGPIYKGPIVPADLMRVASYGYDPASGYGLKLVTFDILGTELIQGLEVGLAYGGDFFLQISGMSFRFDSGAPDFAKIDLGSIKVGGQPLVPGATYSATVNEGSAKLLGALGVSVSNLQVLPDLEFAVLRDYVARAPVLRPSTCPRIWDSALASP